MSNTGVASVEGVTGSALRPAMMPVLLGCPNDVTGYFLRIRSSGEAVYLAALATEVVKDEKISRSALAPCTLSRSSQSMPHLQSAASSALRLRYRAPNDGRGFSAENL